MELNKFPSFVSITAVPLSLRLSIFSAKLMRAPGKNFGKSSIWRRSSMAYPKTPIRSVRSRTLRRKHIQKGVRTIFGCTDAFTPVNSQTVIQKSFNRVTENLCRSSYDSVNGHGQRAAQKGPGLYPAKTRDHVTKRFPLKDGGIGSSGFFVLNKDVRTQFDTILLLQLLSELIERRAISRWRNISWRYWRHDILLKLKNS